MGEALVLAAVAGMCRLERQDRFWHKHAGTDETCVTRPSAN